MIALSLFLASVLTVNAQQERVSSNYIQVRIRLLLTVKRMSTCARLLPSKLMQSPILILVHCLLSLIQQSSYLTKEIAHLNAQLDSMAYYMHEYVNLFTKEYARADKQKRKEQVLKIFRNASINHPLYNDPDKSLVLVYFNSEDYLTQFSLDTDWIAALAEVKKKLAE